MTYVGLGAYQESWMLGHIAYSRHTRGSVVTGTQKEVAQLAESLCQLSAQVTLDQSLGSASPDGEAPINGGCRAGRRG